ncbi:hypothetical protein CL622_03245 [archaeon]|nr:hypothetical protein [archaeon]|tara:strand:- start:455 stop:874 length:420 start_codon:yes stop_codon:yes gene_type:complete
MKNRISKAIKLGIFGLALYTFSQTYQGIEDECTDKISSESNSANVFFGNRFFRSSLSVPVIRNGDTDYPVDTQGQEKPLFRYPHSAPDTATSNKENEDIQQGPSLGDRLVPSNGVGDTPVYGSGFFRRRLSVPVIRGDN